MSRFLVIAIFAIWLSAPQRAAMGNIGPTGGLIIFLCGYFILVVAMALWSRSAARTPMIDLQRRLRQFNRMMFAARVLVPGWFAVGILFLGWKSWTAVWLAPLMRFEVSTPGLIVGSLPAIAALIGLMWAQYPVELALREQNMLVQLDHDLPFGAPPSFAVYLLAKIRLEILFTAVPVVVLMLLRDIFEVTLVPLLERFNFFAIHRIPFEGTMDIAATVMILIFAPEILRRVLQTEPLPDSPLRRKLDEICRRHRIRYRDVLLWRTSHQMGNAAVMGFIPQTRYVLLSDLLVETMSDEQIEAVFAHELGHVIHRHLFWLMATIMGILFLLTGPGQSLADGLGSGRHPLPQWLQWVVAGGGGLAIGAAIFGFVSRRFERQADVFAARTIQALDSPALGPKPNVGQHGAIVFCSALQRVAAINNIPVASPSWSHGSIAKRMGFLAYLGENPGETSAFDRSMLLLYIILAISVVISLVWGLILSPTS